MKSTGLRDLIASTLWIDTHEHLLEEKTRLMEPGTPRHPCEDWALLYWHYVRDDLAASGMPADRLRDFYGSDLDPIEKWILVEPYLKRIATSTYVRAADFSCRRLYGQVPSRETVESITSSMASMRRTGYYERVLRDEAGVELCHVNSREHTFVVSGQPHLLKQDIGIGDWIITDRERIPEWEAETGLEVGVQSQDEV